jgi:hypothetical protein
MMLNEARWRAATEQKLAAACDPMDGAVHRGLVHNITGSLASEGITPLMDIGPTNALWEGLVAWTDFERIYVRYNKHPDPRVLAAVLRGLIFHEGGHIRWSISFTDLMAQAQQVTDSPGQPVFTGHELREYQQAWNAMEDQRMETAVVSDSPRKAAFFVPMILKELMDTPAKATANYPLLIWRRYLPKHIRDGARAMFVEREGEDITVRIEECVDRYVKATTAVEMWDAVVLFTALLKEMRSQVSLPSAAGNHFKHGHGRTNDQNRKDNADKMEIPIDPTMDANPAESKGDEGGENTADAQGQAAAQGSEQGAAGGSKSDDEGDEGDEAQGSMSGGSEDGASESGSESGSDGDDDSEAIGSSGSDDEHQGHGAGARSDQEADHSKGLTQDDLYEALAEAEETRYNDSALNADMDAYHEALSRQGSLLAPYTLIENTDASAAGKAEALAEDLVRSFNMVTTEQLPNWVEGQRSGILNVGRYITHQPGETEYFKQWVEDDIPGHNIAVSVLLDYSTSMSSSVGNLAVAGYACKKACQELDIPCTVVLWDDYAKVLWDGLEEAEFLPSIAPGGNTDPSLALADLDNHRFGKDRHLVLIMTDGVWAFDGRSLAPYQAERIMMGIGYNRLTAKAEKYARHLQDYGCANTYPVTDLATLPRLLEDLLILMA